MFLVLDNREALYACALAPSDPIHETVVDLGELRPEIHEGLIRRRHLLEISPDAIDSSHDPSIRFCGLTRRIHRLLKVIDDNNLLGLPKKHSATACYAFLSPRAFLSNKLVPLLRLPFRPFRFSLLVTNLLFGPRCHGRFLAGARLFRGTTSCNYEENSKEQ